MALYFLLGCGKCDGMNTAGKVITGFLIGAIIGTITGLLTAPATGKRTRKNLERKSKKLAKSMAGYVGIKPKRAQRTVRSRIGKTSVGS